VRAACIQTVITARLEDSQNQKGVRATPHPTKSKVNQTLKAEQLNTTKRTAATTSDDVYLRILHGNNNDNNARNFRFTLPHQTPFISHTSSYIIVRLILSLLSVIVDDQNAKQPNPHLRHLPNVNRLNTTPTINNLPRTHKQPIPNPPLHRQT
jgi:hypothetical protein